MTRAYGCAWPPVDDSPRVAGGSSDNGQPVSLTCWHTDCYEWRNGRWQAVWSQATAISPQD